MELQFYKATDPCLQRVKREVQYQEQTQEVRLGDGMPDIGRVLGTWGQVLLRGKEWRSGGMGITGGIMAWVLYAPEDGGQTQCVETWIPFQMKWDFSDTERDGIINAVCRLKNMDARSTSTRKLIVRACVGVLGEALMPGEMARYMPQELPEDIQILKKTYPLYLPREAGEKPFNLEEVLDVPGSVPAVEKLMRYELQTELIDQKVLGSKVVFRGAGILHILYRADDGNLYTWDFELPFSQYSELDHDYEQDAQSRVWLAVTGLELDRDDEGKLHLKAGLTAQYMISDRTMVEVVEDAYSPRRRMTAKTEAQQLPCILDETVQTIRAEQTAEVEGGRVVDIAFYPDHPRLLRGDSGIEAEIPVQFQLLYYDQDGVLQCTAPRWEGRSSLNAGEYTQVEAVSSATGKAQAVFNSGRAELRGEVLMEATTGSQRGVPMITGLELGEMTEPDPNRPSLILCRAGEEALWDIAKRTGATVEGIREANHLSDEASPGQMLLIPIA